MNPTRAQTLLASRDQVATLKERCRARRLPVGGRKDDLVARLIGDGAGGAAAQRPIRK